MNREDIRHATIVASLDQRSRSIVLYGGGERLDGTGYVLMPVTIEPKETTVYADPFLELNPKQAQALIDDLWYCGLRPSQVGGEGALAATQRHLDDMRTIAFKSLKIEKAK